MFIYESPIAPNQTFSQAYWSAVIFAALYFLLSVMLMINMLGYFLGHYPQSFVLTDDQRTLILQTLGFIVWLAIGGAIFSQVIDIDYADAVYFSNVAILTLGFGDMTSPDPVARGLIFPYAVIEMVLLGLVVSSIHRFAQEIHRDNVLMNHIKRKRKAAVRRSEFQS
jgi:potassium channel subfamily K